MYSLFTYRFNPLKIGAALRQLKKVSGHTPDDIEDKTGISADTTKNLLKGKGVLTLERALKYCVVFKIPIESFVALLIEGDDIDFADQILTYDPTKSKTTPLTADEVTPIADTLPETVVEATLAAAEASPPPVADRFPVPVDPEYLKHLDDLRAHIASLDAQLGHQNVTIEKLLGMLER